ncbi:metallophosphoesterase [Myxococcota bacterium]|nr:metallophosphoesterase [Myxococcota bacterium]
MKQAPLSLRLKLELALLIGLVAAVLGGLWLRPAPPRRHPVLSWEGHAQEVRQVPRNGGLDVTLLHVSDLHAGAEACDNHTGFAALDRCGPIEPWHHRLIERMRSMAGTDFPEEAGGGAVQPAKAGGGAVQPAEALLVTGDVTQDGKEAEWAAYLRLFGPGSGLPFAVWDFPGNHDLRHPALTRLQFLLRQGGSRYVRDLGDLRLIALGEAPDQDDLVWLRGVLASTGRARPVIVALHLPFEGPYSYNWFTRDTFTESLGRLLEGFNIIAILHGHYHESGFYRWKGFDVYNIGSVKHHHRDFGVLHVTDTHLIYAAWNLEFNDWWWIHSKPINGHPGPETLKILRGAPWVPYPQSAD